MISHISFLAIGLKTAHVNVKRDLSWPKMAASWFKLAQSWTKLVKNTTQLGPRRSWLGMRILHGAYGPKQALGRGL